MEHRHSPIQPYYLFKSFVIMFLIQAVIVLFMPMALTAGIWYQILIVNVLVGLVLGWYLYKQWYHIEFSYDDVSFALKKGKNPSTEHRWDEFSQVSLVRNEYGEFVVRLHGKAEPFEIPVSKLKLDPFQFRFEAMDHVAKPI
jgi:hypothetical protein